MYRILAVDYGQKNIGLALSDPLRMFARPYMTLNNSGFDSVAEQLKRIIREQTVEVILLGLPLSVAGLDTQKTAEVREFHHKLEEYLQREVLLWDERYTTMDAKEHLISKGIKQKDGKKVIDQIAAAMILKNYLEAQK